MNDVLPKIFGFLSVPELVRCRLVCKTWMHLVERDLKELCLYVRGSFALDVWIIDGQLIRQRSVLTIQNLSLLSNPNFVHTFRNLRKLLIKCDQRTGHSPAAREELSHLNQLANFKQLQHLELHGLVLIAGIESSGLQSVTKFISTGVYRSSDPALRHSLPANLQTAGFFFLPDDTVLGQLNDRLKVLIAREYSSTFMRLTNLERLHLTFLMERDKKPAVFVGHFEKLQLLDIYRVNCERWLTEIQDEVASLKPTRIVRFFHNCCEVSNEKLKRLEFVDTIDLDALLPVASEHPDRILPYIHFLSRLDYRENRLDRLTRPLRFEFLKNFRNVKNLFIWTVTNYEDLGNLVKVLRHLLILSIGIHDLDRQFFDDLPGILEHLVVLKVSFRSEVAFDSLHFLSAFQQLLAFRGSFQKNEANQQIIESIEERRKGMRFPLLVKEFELESHQLICRNFLDQTGI